MPGPRVLRDDLAAVLSSHRGGETLRSAVERAADPPSLLSVVARYVQFNSAFGAGVANLAGEIAARQGLFRDAEEPVLILSDRAAEVAADFFHAAIDEFDDRATPWRDTHRTLAQATIKAMGGFFGYAPVQLNDVLRINPATDRAREQVWEGYGMGMRLDEPALFRAMGFHAGSEVLADQEFTILDRSLRATRPELVRALESTTVEILGARHSAYYWVHIHTSVEADHFDAALAGVNKALRYYAGAAGREAAKGWVLEGFSRFADVQARFMAELSAN
jgi:hypothetical protein